MWGEIATDRPDRPDRGHKCVHIVSTQYVTLHRLGGQPEELGSDNVGIDVTKWAESIGEGIRARGHRWIAQPEITDQTVDKNVSTVDTSGTSNEMATLWHARNCVTQEGHGCRRRMPRRQRWPHAARRLATEGRLHALRRLTCNNINSWSSFLM